MDLWRFAPTTASVDTGNRPQPACRRDQRTVVPGIDYLLAAPMPSGRLPHVELIQRVGDQPINGAWASDHAGVMAMLELG